MLSKTLTLKQKSFPFLYDKTSVATNDSHYNIDLQLCKQTLLKFYLNLVNN